MSSRPRIRILLNSIRYYGYYVCALYTGGSARHKRNTPTQINTPHICCDTNSLLRLTDDTQNPAQQHQQPTVEPTCVVHNCTLYSIPATSTCKRVISFVVSSHLASCALCVSMHEQANGWCINHLLRIGIHQSNIINSDRFLDIDDRANAILVLQRNENSTTIRIQ